MTTCPSCTRELPGEFPFCPFCGAALDETETRPAREERKVITVLFADLVGFTARAEKLDPEDVRTILSRYHGHLRSELERFGGRVEKFIGDAVMALFGAPVAHEDDPERAVRAALAIRDWGREQEGALQVRIGIDTGEALVALDARPSEGEAMAAGDVVNTAARLQSAAPTNGVLVGEATFRACARAIRFEETDPVVAKGKSEPIAVWEAVEARARLGADIADRPATTLVGRARELELLVSTLDRALVARSPQLVTLVGVPGIGKSRLVRELFGRLDRDVELTRWRQGRSLPYGDGVTFWALAEIVKSEAGILETDAPKEAARKLADAVTALPLDSEEAEWVEHQLRPLTGVAEAAVSSREESSAAWRRFLEALAEDHPLVLVFEDLHWADDALLDFVDALVDRVSGVPMLVLATARPELLQRRPGWGGGKPNSLTISLSALGDAEAAELVAQLLRRPVLDAETQRELLDRAGGNPLYAEQYARALAERGALDELPETVHGIIAARLDALTDDEKTVVQNAAVVGKVFWTGAVEAVDSVSRWDVEELLHALERKEFVQRSRGSSVAGEREYGFQHVLIRDVAYAQIPRAARSAKHRRVASWVESLGRPEDQAEMLAHHYEQALELARAAGIDQDAELVERARDAFRDAAERAMSLSAAASAAEFFAAALDLSPQNDPERAQLLLGSGKALLACGGDPLELLSEALDSFLACGNIERAAEAATVAASYSWKSGNRPETDRFIGTALDLLSDQPASIAKVTALAAQSGFHMLGGQFEDSIRVGAEALPLAEELELGEQRARLEIAVGCAHCCLGDAEGLRQIERGIEIARAAGSVENVIVGWGNLASELFFLGRLDESREADQEWRRELDAAERFGLTRWRPTERVDAAGWSIADGAWDDALEILDGIVAAIDAGERDYTDASAFALRAAIAVGRGELEAAARDSETAAELARASDAQARSQAFTVRALVALAAGRREEAVSLAADLAEIGPVLLPALNAAYPTFAETAWVFRDLGLEEAFSQVLDATPIPGGWMEAARAIVTAEFARAADVIAEMGHEASAAYARLRAGEALAAEGRQAEAATQLEAARAFYAKAGARAYLRRCDAITAFRSTG